MRSSAKALFFFYKFGLIGVLIIFGFIPRKKH
jgi:hypothetical protein